MIWFHKVFEHSLEYEKWFNLINLNFIWFHEKAHNFVEHCLEYEEWWWRNLSRRWDSYRTMWNIVRRPEMESSLRFWKLKDAKTVWICNIDANLAPKLAPTHGKLSTESKEAFLLLNIHCSLEMLPAKTKTYCHRWV